MRPFTLRFCSLAGWGFAAEMVQPLDQSLRVSLGVPPGEFTARETTHKWFEDAHVTAFACTHTCMAYAQGFPAENGLGDRAVFNNGSSGMPSFQGVKCGVATRVSSDLSPPRDSLYGCTLRGPTPGSAVRFLPTFERRAQLITCTRSTRHRALQIVDLRVQFGT